eukprot:1150917-Pelagomonas_calceolata.AAC.1
MQRAVHSVMVRPEVLQVSYQGSEDKRMQRAVHCVMVRPEVLQVSYQGSEDKDAEGCSLRHGATRGAAKGSASLQAHLHALYVQFGSCSEDQSTPSTTQAPPPGNCAYLPCLGAKLECLWSS